MAPRSRPGNAFAVAMGMKSMARYFGWLLIFAAVVGVTGGASFGAGRAYEARQVTPVATTAAGAAARTSFAGPNGASRPTNGVVSKVEGQTLTITTADNQSVTVTVPADAPISRQAPISFTDLSVGTRVSVVSQATPLAGGAIVAQSVAVVPDGVGGGRGGPGGGGATRGASPDGQATPTPATR